MPFTVLLLLHAVSFTCAFHSISITRLLHYTPFPLPALEAFPLIHAISSRSNKKHHTVSERTEFNIKTTKLVKAERKYAIKTNFKTHKLALKTANTYTDTSKSALA